MNLLDRGNVYSPSDAGGARGAQSGARKSYDTLAGSAVLRRAGKAATGIPLRGDQVAALLAARHKTEFEDRIGNQLRAYYQSMLREPVPERLVALVDALAAEAPR